VSHMVGDIWVPSPGFELAEEHEPNGGACLLMRSRHAMSLVVNGILVPPPGYKHG